MTRSFEGSFRLETHKSGEPKVINDFDDHIDDSLEPEEISWKKKKLAIETPPPPHTTFGPGG